MFLTVELFAPISEPCFESLPEAINKMFDLIRG